MNPSFQSNPPSARTCDVCVFYLKGHGCCNSARDFLRRSTPKERTCDLFKPVHVATLAFSAPYLPARLGESFSPEGNRTKASASG